MVVFLLIILIVIIILYLNSYAKANRMKNSSKETKTGSLLYLCKKMECYPNTAFSMFVINSKIQFLNEIEIQDLLIELYNKKIAEANELSIHPDDTTASWFEFWCHKYLGKIIDNEKEIITKNYSK